MVGITNITTITMDNITGIVNASNFPELLININHTVYGGMFFFVMLWVLWVILLKVAEDRYPDILRNAMYSGVVVSLVSFLLRGVIVLVDGTIHGMVTDFQLWIFPLITIILAVILWQTRE